MEYTFDEHRHCFSVWACCHAIPDKLISKQKIRAAIEHIQLKGFIQSAETIVDQKKFDELLSHWSTSMSVHFNSPEVDVPFGIVTKLIAVYLKVSVSLSNPEAAAVTEFIHPPLCNAMLKVLPDNGQYHSIRGLDWKTMQEGDYWEVVKAFRQELGIFNWKLEMACRPDFEKY